MAVSSSFIIITTTPRSPVTSLSSDQFITYTALDSALKKYECMYFYNDYIAYYISSCAQWSSRWSVQITYLTRIGIYYATLSVEWFGSSPVVTDYC